MITVKLQRMLNACYFFYVSFYRFFLLFYLNLTLQRHIECDTTLMANNFYKNKHSVTNIFY